MERVDFVSFNCDFMTYSNMTNVGVAVYAPIIYGYEDKYFNACVEFLKTGKETKIEFGKAHCISGNARGTYTVPRRRLTQTRSTNRTNWVLFVFLLIFTPPIGLLYGFITSGRRGKIVFGILLLLLIALFVTGIILVTTQGY